MMIALVLGLVIFVVLSAGMAAVAHLLSKRFLAASAVCAVASGLIFVVFAGLLSGPDPFYLIAFAVSSIGAFAIALVMGIFVHLLRPHQIPAGYCQICGYNLTGNESGVCPECGTPWRDPEAMQKRSPAAATSDIERPAMSRHLTSNRHQARSDRRPREAGAASLSFSPAYDLSQSYQWNYDHGPNVPPELFAQEPAAVPGTFELAGIRLNGPLGVAAGPLLNSRWIAAYAKLGFDFLTYKTVRTEARPCYVLPNWVFVETRQLSERDTEEGSVYEIDAATGRAQGLNLSSAVSFGMPCQPPDVWRADVRAARDALADGQALVVSVVGSPREGWGPDDLAADFAQAAAWAAQAGAHVVEANLSCPNVASAEGGIYADPELASRVTRACVEAVDGVPLLLKVGHLPDDDRLSRLLRAVDGLAAGVVTLNTVATRIERTDGAPSFGQESRRRSGVTGRAIFNASLKQVRRAARIMGRDRLSLELIAVGGAFTAADVQLLMDAGASLVEMATAPVFHPDAALRIRQALREAAGPNESAPES